MQRVGECGAEGRGTLRERIARRVKYQLLGHRDVAATKIFCIGLAKTGTSSFTSALQVLGYRSIHYAPCFEVNEGRVSFQWPWWLSGYDAYSDVPVAYFFKDLHAMYPNAKFVLTVREQGDWLRSCSRHFTLERHHAATRDAFFCRGATLNEHIYGTDVFDEASFVEAYEHHNVKVQEHFAACESSTLIKLDVCGGEGWEKLCPFLGKEIPAGAFPHDNYRATKPRHASAAAARDH